MESPFGQIATAKEGTEEGDKAMVYQAGEEDEVQYLGYGDVSGEEDNEIEPAGE